MPNYLPDGQPFTHDDFYAGGASKKASEQEPWVPEHWIEHHKVVEALLFLQTIGGGTTDLSIGAVTAFTLDVESNSGLDATVPAATDLAAGLMTAADKIVLDHQAPLEDLTFSYSGGDLVGVSSPSKNLTIAYNGDGTIDTISDSVAPAWTKTFGYVSGDLTTITVS